MSAVWIAGDLSFTDIVPQYYQVSVTTSAQNLATLISGTIPKGATAVYITPEGGSIRYRADGTPPTTSVGQPIAQGQSWPITGPAALAAIQLIAPIATIVSLEFRG